MNILFIKQRFVGFMVSEIPRVSEYISVYDIFRIRLLFPIA